MLVRNSHKTDLNKIRSYISNNAPCGMPSWKGNAHTLEQNALWSINEILYDMEYNYLHINSGYSSIQSYVIAKFKKQLKENKVLKDFAGFPWDEFASLLKNELGWMDKKEDEEDYWEDRRNKHQEEEEEDYWKDIDEEFSKYN